MSGVILPTPAYKAEDWQGFITQVAKQRIGFMSLSLTNYDNNLEPQIAIASVVEINQSLFRFMEDTPIIGTPSSGVMNYIVLIPSGSGEDQIASPNWTTVAPYWKDTRQGWYSVSGTQRYVARCWYDGTYYTQKRVLGGWRRKVREDHVDDDGTINTVSSSCGLEDAITKYVTLSEAEGNSGLVAGTYYLVNFPHGAILNQAKIQCYEVGGNLNFYLHRKAFNESSNPSTTQIDSWTGSRYVATHTISDTTIDNDTNMGYWFHWTAGSGSSHGVYGVSFRLSISELRDL